MILQCPNCSARFMVPDALVPPEGRAVKCGKCAHQWHTLPTAAPDFAALTEQAMQEMPADVPPPTHPVPAIARRPLSLVPFKIAVPVLACCWLVVALYAYFPQGQVGWLKGLYAALGATNTHGLVFADVTMERDDGGPRTKFTLAGSIANHDAVARTVPRVRVQLKDKAGDVVWERDYPVDQEIKAGEVYPFRIDDIETAFAGNASSMVLDLGNGFELGMR